MSDKTRDLREEWRRLSAEEGEDALKTAFLQLVPDSLPADEIFADCRDAFADEELGEICAEFVLTINADCSNDEFHNWNYDHLEFIIGLSNQYTIQIPLNLLNGLPEQLILLVDSKKLQRPEC
jgi:hypothetical protein